jgi:hypothetical protein
MINGHEEAQKAQKRGDRDFRIFARFVPFCGQILLIEFWLPRRGSA